MYLCTFFHSPFTVHACDSPLIVPSRCGQFQTGPFIFQGKGNDLWPWSLITPLPQCARSSEKWWQTVLQNCPRCAETRWLKLESDTSQTGYFNYSPRSGQEKIKHPVTVCGSVCNGDAKGSLDGDPHDRERTERARGHRGLGSTRIIVKSVIPEEEIWPISLLTLNSGWSIWDLRHKIEGWADDHLTVKHSEEINR